MERHGESQQSSKTCFAEVIQTTVWLILRHRNHVCFDPKSPRRYTLEKKINKRVFINTNKTQMLNKTCKVNYEKRFLNK